MKVKTLSNNVFFELVQEQLSQGKEVLIPVRGNSMLPFLREGQRVLLKAEENRKVQLGDIVLAKWQDKVILHRIIRCFSDEIWLAGDNNLGQIEKLYRQDILAFMNAYYTSDNTLKKIVNWDRFLGLCWYYMRWPRIIYKKIKI